jgi:type II secretory pathway pseudopilin PulG
MDLAKTILAVIMVLVLALTVVRPLLRSLAEKGAAAQREEQLRRMALEAERRCRALNTTPGGSAGSGNARIRTTRPTWKPPAGWCVKIPSGWHR